MNDCASCLSAINKQVDYEMRHFKTMDYYFFNLFSEKTLGNIVKKVKFIKVTTQIMCH